MAGTPSPPLRMVKSPARLSSWPATVPGTAMATGTVPLPRWERSNIKRGVGHAPAVGDPADEGVVVDTSIGDEHLVEQCPARHLGQGADLDAGLVHVEREVRDALVLGQIGIGAGDEHAHVGDLTTGGPDLLAVDDPLVAVAVGPALQPGEVGTGPGFGEQLTPAGLAVEDGRHVALDLFGRAVRGDGGRSEHHAQTAGRTQGVALGDGTQDRLREIATPAPAAGLLGKHRMAVALVGEELPPLGDGEVGIPVGVDPGAGVGFDLGCGGCAHVGPLVLRPVRPSPR